MKLKILLFGRNIDENNTCNVRTIINNFTVNHNIIMHDIKKKYVILNILQLNIISF